jgi:cell division protein YceG involved in septum cleavage
MKRFRDYEADSDKDGQRVDEDFVDRINHGRSLQANLPTVYIDRQKSAPAVRLQKTDRASRSDQERKDERWNHYTV